MIPIARSGHRVSCNIPQSCTCGSDAWNALAERCELAERCVELMSEHLSADVKADIRSCLKKECLHMTSEKCDWNVYRFTVAGEDSYRIAPTDGDAWEYLGLARDVSLEVRATIHGATRSKALAVADMLRV